MKYFHQSKKQTFQEWQICKVSGEMSNLQKYITKRKKTDKEFAKDYDKGFENFKIGVLIQEARLEKGLTQEQLANKVGTKKSGSTGNLMETG